MQQRRRSLLAIMVLLAALAGVTGCNSPQRDGANGDTPSSTPRSPVRPTP